MKDKQKQMRYDYDAANRLQIVKRDDGTYIQAFQFGSTNARLMSHQYITNQATMIASVGGTTLAEYPEFTPTVMTWTKSYIYLGDSQLSTISKAGSSEITEFNHPDRLGTRVITNQALGTSYEQTTLPFGTALNAESTTSQSKRFTSYERSAQTGLDYAINRTYDSKLGRFTQVDPIGMGATSLGSPQTLNLYSYCGNDPINHTDPFGLFFGKLFKWIAKALKWIVLAVTIVVAVLSMVASHGTLSPFLGGVLKFLVGALAKFGGLLKFASGGLLVAEGSVETAALGLKGLTILAGVGSIASHLDGKKKEDGRGSPAEIRRTFFRLYGKKFNKCLKQIFGKDYKKIGKQTLNNGPVLDATQTAVQLGGMSSVPAAYGNNDPGFGKNGKAFVAQEVYTSRGANVRKAVFGTYAHETGNILDAKINPNPPNYESNYPNANPVDPVTGVTDGDTGANVERCVFGSLQYP